MQFQSVGFARISFQTTPGGAAAACYSWSQWRVWIWLSCIWILWIVLSRQKKSTIHCCREASRIKCLICYTVQFKYIFGSFSLFLFWGPSWQLLNVLLKTYTSSHGCCWIGRCVCVVIANIIPFLCYQLALSKSLSVHCPRVSQLRGLFEFGLTFYTSTF